MAHRNVCHVAKYISPLVRYYLSLSFVMTIIIIKVIIIVAVYTIHNFDGDDDDKEFWKWRTTAIIEQWSVL